MVSVETVGSIFLKVFKLVSIMIYCLKTKCGWVQSLEKLRNKWQKK